jgi:hypothetical protein
MTHDELVNRAAAWLYNRERCGVVITEMSSGARECPDAIGWIGTQSILVECKTSRSDFTRDKAKWFRDATWSKSSMGNLRYFLAPKGIIKVDELPPQWGLLEATASGITPVVPATPFNGSRSEETVLLCSALRRIVPQQRQAVRVRTYVDGVAGVEEARASLAVRSEPSPRGKSVRHGYVPASGGAVICRTQPQPTYPTSVPLS